MIDEICMCLALSLIQCTLGLETMGFSGGSCIAMGITPQLQHFLRGLAGSPQACISLDLGLGS